MKIKKFEEFFFLVNCLLDPFCGRGRSSAQGSLREFFVFCPPYVKAGEAGGVHQLKSLTNLFVFNKYFFLKYRGDLGSKEKVASKPYLSQCTYYLLLTTNILLTYYLPTTYLLLTYLPYFLSTFSVLSQYFLSNF